MTDQRITTIKRKAGGSMEHPVECSPEIFSTALKLSFINIEDSFVNVKWTSVSTSLNAISDRWEFVAFGFDHRSVIITTPDKSALDNFQKITSVEISGGNKPIGIEQLKGGSCKGIIFNKCLIPLEDDEILNSLADFGVTEIYRVQKFDDATNKSYYTGSVILNFSSDNFPTKLEINKAKISVNRLTPKPMLCSHCGLIGHTFKRCRIINRINCSICFYTHSIDSECRKNCKNCDNEDDHYSNDSSCPAFKNEIKILKIKEKHNINYLDAKAIAGSILDLDNNTNSKKSDEASIKIKELIAKNTRYFNELNLSREENKKISAQLSYVEEENINLKTVVIPNLQSNFQKYKEENEGRTNNLQRLLEEHVAATSLDITKLTEENILIVNENNTLKNNISCLNNKNNDLTLKCEKQKELIKNSHNLLNEFSAALPENAAAINFFLLKNKNYSFVVKELKKNSTDK